MHPKAPARQVSRTFLVLSLLIISMFATLQFPLVRAQTFSAPQPVPMGTTLSLDTKLRFVDAAPANNTALKRDFLLKFVDLNANGHWDPGEPVLYDSNNDSIFESTEPIIAGTVSPGAQLSRDPLIKYVDINGDNLWDAGEVVVYDINNSNVYLVGDPVIGGTPVVPGAALTYDSHVKFVGPGSSWIPGNPVVYDSNSDGLYSASTDPHLKYVDTNNNGHWDPGKPVVYDANLSGAYATGDRVLYGPTPTVGTPLKVDLKIMFIDANRNGVWDTGEAVVYDSNADGVYESIEPVILAANPPPLVGLNSDLKIKFVDAIGNSIWAAGETVVYDTIGQGYFNATIDPKIQYFDADANGIYDPGPDTLVYNIYGGTTYKTGDPIIVGPNPPTDGSAILTIDRHFHFVDANLSGRWAKGDTVVYNARSDHIYVTGDLVVAGPTPPNGTFLMEPVLAGARPAVGTPIKFDSKMKYVETDGNVWWNPGEAVVYDTNSKGVFDPCCGIVVVGISPLGGTLLSEPVMAGATPTIGTLLKSDPNLKFIDVAKTGLWSPGETVVYDGNSNALYDRTKPVIANGAPGTGAWISREVVVYDNDSNSIYETREPVVFGTSPLNGTALGSDNRIKYIDTDNNGRWDPGETVVYDTNNNNVYDQGDIVIAGPTPATNLFLSPSAAVDYVGRIWLTWNEKPVGSLLNPIIYFKMWNGTAWSNKQSVTTGSSNDAQSFVTQLVNQTMMILWSSNSTGHPQIFYKFYSSVGNTPRSIFGPVQLTSSIMNDKAPSAIQDRNGRIWVTWSRQNSQGTLSQVFYKYNNGTGWSSEFPLPPASVSNLGQKSPSITQTRDGKIRVFWSSNDTKNLNLYYTTTNGTVTTLPSTGIPASSWTPKTGFPFSSAEDDDHPAFVQARDGTYWVFFQRSILSPPSEYIFYATATDPNGVSWSLATQLTTGEDTIPTAVQNSDRRIWVFWNTLISSGLQIVSTSSSTPITAVNDVGVRSLSATPGLVRSTYPVNITTMISNYGDSVESAKLTIIANNTSNVLKAWNLTLTSGQTQTIYFNWTSAQPWGRYTIVASLTNISPAENFAANQGDESLALYPLRVSPPGDANGDGKVNILDLALVAICYGKIPTPGTMCNQYVDVDNDPWNPIGVLDLALVAINYGKSV
jgi:hypothetical protein